MKESEKLRHLVDDVESWHNYFDRNLRRYSFFRKLIYETTLTESQRAFLTSLNRPIAEFNLYNSYVNKVLNDFNKIEPSIYVSTDETLTKVADTTCKLVQAHYDYICYRFNKSGQGLEVFKDMVTGGFGAIRVRTRYAHAMSMSQVVELERADPLYTGFDRKAKAKNKGDGRFSFEVFSMDLEKARKEFDCPDLNCSQSDIGGFNWSHTDEKGRKSITLCEFFEKTEKRVQIVQLANGSVVEKRKYDKELAEWESILPPPAVVGEPRWTTKSKITRYVFSKQKILKKEATNWVHLPHSFADANSVMLNDGGFQYQHTRPIIYDARGIQDLKNASGISLLNHLENMVQSKFIVKKEAIPIEDDYQQSITNIQQVGTVVVNAFKDNNPDQPIPEPITTVQQTPAPPEVMGAFNSAEQTFQTIQGGFSSTLGRTNSDLSGKALIEAASLDNQVNGVYMADYVKSLEWAGHVAMGLFPNYIIGTRSIPVRLPDSSIKNITVNEHDKDFAYEPYDLEMRIDVGFTNEVQQQKNAEQMTMFAQSYQGFAAFMNSKQGLPLLIEQMTVKNKIEVQDAFKDFAQEQEEAAKQGQPNPELILAQAEMERAQAEKMRAEADMMRAQTDAERKRIEAEIEAAKIMVQQQEADAKMMLAQKDLELKQIRTAMEVNKTERDLTHRAIETAHKMLGEENKEHMEHLKHEMEANNV